MADTNELDFYEVDEAYVIQNSAIPNAGEITSAERMLSACSGGVFTTLLMTPLDVVKVRMQSRDVPKRGLTSTVTPALNGGTLTVMKSIIHGEGFFMLWRGLSAGLVMAVPSTVIYFAGYDWMRQQTQNSRFANSVLHDSSPLWAGALARIVAATIISPLELFRTRLQAAEGKHGVTGVSKGIIEMVKRDGPTSLWRGISSTLLRDVPFSAFYWMGYENIKHHLQSRPSYKHDTMSNFQSSFIAGASSGMLASVVTTPFDVIKTQRQISSIKDMPLSRLIKDIIANEGYKGFFRGTAPRVIKVAPGCAIMISSYEFGKLVFADRRRAKST
ncbi:mitochondrial carrier domain-containing protein [Phycomyces blakesleeanus]